MKKILFACASLAMLWGCNDPQKKEEKKKTATVNFPVTQREIFSLSMISNLPACIVWPRVDNLTEQNYADSIITYISPFMDSTLLYASDNSTGSRFTLSNWTRVWGPAVIVDSECDMCNKYYKRSWLKDSAVGKAFVPVSSMTIFKDNNNNYVVGIEATNESSTTDWVALDMNVFTTRQFDNTAAHGSLSMGTSIGLNTYLLALTDMHTHQTAMQYLDTVSKMNSLTVTGHSLGGALSPVFALYLKNNLTKNNGNIYCLATAGASPGDTAFISYFNQQMGGNTVRLWNSLDVVPHAWEVDTMKRINSIYQPASASMAIDSPFNCDGNTKPSQPFAGLATPPDIVKVVNGLVDGLTKEKLVYGSICNGGQTFTGTQKAGCNYFNSATPFQPSIYTKLFPDALTFIDQLGNQHVIAYSMYFQILGIHEYMHGWITANRVKNNVTWWDCNPAHVSCGLGEVPISRMAPASSRYLDQRTVRLWGAIQHAAWKW